jgi:coatomer subunit beta
VFRGILWILGEYVENTLDIQTTMREVRNVLGEIPILASEQRLLDDSDAEVVKERVEKEAKSEGGSRPKVLADGTYATETAYMSVNVARLEAVKAAVKPPLRTLILAGDYFTGTVLAAALTKLVLRFAEQSTDFAAANSLRAQVSFLFYSYSY